MQGQLLERPLDGFVRQHADEFASAFAQNGWPHFWRGSAAEAVASLKQRGVRAFELVSTLGLHGWILAAETNGAVTPG